MSERIYWGKTREQMTAHFAVQRALARGEIVVPDACEDGCGATGEHLVPHHDDYSRPLDVRFLTRRCHRAFHFAERVAARMAVAT